jgi:hypothetical protein
MKRQIATNRASRDYAEALLQRPAPYRSTQYTQKHTSKYSAYMMRALTSGAKIAWRTGLGPVRLGPDMRPWLIGEAEWPQPMHSSSPAPLVLSLCIGFDRRVGDRV